MRRERGFGANPWMTHSRFLVSHNCSSIRATPTPMRAWLGPLRPGSLLILDEAHNAAPSSGGRYGIESKFTRAVRDLAGRFEHRLFLSATPHNGHRADDRIEVIDGLTQGARRKEVQRRFNADPAADPLCILLATDAAREGLNFQGHCADLFHFDLPWNPGRIEQRNGRIDRKLQPAAEVRCHYFVLPQREEDKVLEVLVRKTETIKRELGSLSKVIDDDVERRLRGGIRHHDADRLKHAIATADLDEVRRQITEDGLEAARDRRDDLTEQVERCRGLLERSQTWVGFEAGPFRDALSCAPRPVRSRPETGAGAIRAFYEVQAKRVEPVGLVYLWPETN